MIKIIKAKYLIIPPLSILEDVMEYLDIIVRTLKSGGITFTYQVADYPIKYQQLFKNNVFDVIISDDHLFNFDIFELLKLQQELWQKNHLSLIAGDLKEEKAWAILKAGVNDDLLPERLFTWSNIWEQAIAESRLKKYNNW